jgi:preprotein translocase subunit YajC
MTGLLVLGILLVAFWFVLVRPQRTRAREQQELIHDLETGDEIVSAGGFYGTITEIDGDVLHVEIAPGLIVRMARGAVAGIVETEEETEEPAEAEEPDETDDAEPESSGNDPHEPGKTPESRYPEAP